MRIKKNIKKGIIGWFNSKFSNLTSHKLYGKQWGELLMKSWELKGKDTYGNHMYQEDSAWM